MSKTFINKVQLYTDGGSRGNPGPGAIGIVICNESNRILHEFAECIGHCTNNQAEYKALIKGLDLCAKHTRGEVLCFCDSELLVKQMNGVFRIKNDRLRELFHEVHRNCTPFSKVTFQHLTRKNQIIQRADQILNDAQNGNSINSSTD